MLIYAPPAVLTLHLKRFEQVGSGLRKLSRHVEFGELLDLAPYCSRLAEVTLGVLCRLGVSILQRTSHIWPVRAFSWPVITIWTCTAEGKESAEI